MCGKAAPANLLDLGLTTAEPAPDKNRETIMPGKTPSRAAGACAIVAALALGAGQLHAAARSVETVCGADNVEDMVDLPGTRWILGGGMGDRYFQGGGLHLIDKERGMVRKLQPAMAEGTAAQAPYDGCPGPVPAAAFSAHGLSLVTAADGTHRLFVVNHGARESIEVFAVETDGGEPAVRWIGCVLAPDTAMTNSVAGRPDGSLVLSASSAGDTPVPSFHALSQKPAAEQGHEWDDGQVAAQPGALFTWNREEGWRKVPNSALPGNNGVELSRDGQWAFVNSWPGQSMTRLPLDPARGEPVTVPLGFKADNLRWSDEGTLVATGQAADVKEVIACTFGDGSNCAIAYRAVAIDPATLAVTPLFSAEGTDRFGAATVGLRTGGNLWLGSLRSHCIARVPAR